MRKINLIIILSLTLSFLSACGYRDSAPRELLGTWRVLGGIENGELVDFAEVLPDTQFYMKIDKTNTTILIESDELDEEVIEKLIREINRDAANPLKYKKIGDNAWRTLDSTGESSELYLLGDYLFTLDKDGGLGIAIR
jgi:hypothetical protein